MRSWFYRHPNVAVVLLGLAVLWTLYRLGLNIAAEQWGWAAVNAVGAVAFMDVFATWWRRT